jgi:hypothetical protein
MKFLKNLFDAIYLRFTEKSFDSGVELGIVIGNLNAHTEMLELFDPESKKKWTEAQVHKALSEQIWGEE